MIRDKPTPREDTEYRMNSPRELDFNQERDTREGSIEDLRPTGEAEQEYASESVVEHGDQSPYAPYDQTGARSPDEPGGGPADTELRTVGESEIGGGIGLDEGELGRSAPPRRQALDRPGVSGG
jgi:hypothetical protein